MGAPPEADKIRDAAMERIQNLPSMVVDGDAIEELAKAHERHADRLDGIVYTIEDVGKRNYLGDTSEGRAATNNIRVAVHEDPHSVVATYRHQAGEARKIACALREIKWNNDNVERESEAGIRATHP